MRRSALAMMRLGGLWRCCSAVLPSTAQTWTWASVRPGMSVRPLRSSVSTLPSRAPTRPERSTSLMRSPSTTTAAPSAGSLPVQSIRNAFVRTVMAMPASLLACRYIACADLGFVHPHLLVGARRPVDPVGDAVEVVLLPEEDPRRLVVDHLLDLGPGLEPLLRVDDGDRLAILSSRLVAAVGRVGLAALEELLDRALRVQRRPPAEEEHVAGRAVLDLVEVRAPLVDDHVDRDAQTLEL